MIFRRFSDPLSIKVHCQTQASSNTHVFYVLHVCVLACVYAYGIKLHTPSSNIDTRTHVSYLEVKLMHGVLYRPEFPNHTTLLCYRIRCLLLPFSLQLSHLSRFRHNISYHIQIWGYWREEMWSSGDGDEI